MGATLQLRAMSAAEFDEYMARTLPTYARDAAKAVGWAYARALEKARAQVEGLLPDGVETKGHHFAHLVVDGERAGVLWFAEQLDQTPPRVFLYDVVVQAARRGQGIGTAAMQVLEREALRLGAEQLMLSVFEHNTGAIRLYERLGFVAHEKGLGGMHMSKRIAGEDA